MIAVAVATLREVATVILSYIVYPKVFSLMHAVSAILVLGGILLTLTCSSSGGGEDGERTSSNQTASGGERIQVELGGVSNS